MKLYYVFSPIGFVREVCVAHSEDEAVKLVTKELDKWDTWPAADGKGHDTLLIVIELKADDYPVPTVLNTGW